MQLVFAGKAHPADLGGQGFAQEIYNYAHDPRFTGRVVLVDDYDMHVGRMLTSGCDVWLNNPLRPQEASGTSGMKPPLHGGINCSILDGWWPECFNGKNGWAIGGREFKSQKQQDRYDAESIYALLERQIVPAFYNRNRAGLPLRWIGIMRESMRTVCANSTRTAWSESIGKSITAAPTNRLPPDARYAKNETYSKPALVRRGDVADSTSAPPRTIA